MARSEGYLRSKIDQKTHPRNQNQVHRAATSFLAGETVDFCADAHAGPRYHDRKLALCSIRWHKVGAPRCVLPRGVFRPLLASICYKTARISGVSHLLHIAL